MFSHQITTSQLPNVWAVTACIAFESQFTFKGKSCEVLHPAAGFVLLCFLTAGGSKTVTDAQFILHIKLGLLLLLLLPSCSGRSDYRL